MLIAIALIDYYYCIMDAKFTEFSIIIHYLYSTRVPGTRVLPVPAASRKRKVKRCNLNSCLPYVHVPYYNILLVTEVNRRLISERYYLHIFYWNALTFFTIMIHFGLFQTLSKISLLHQRTCSYQA